MNTSTKQTENLAECGNKSKPLLAVVFSDEDIEKLEWILSGLSEQKHNK